MTTDTDGSNDVITTVIGPTSIALQLSCTTAVFHFQEYRSREHAVISCEYAVSMPDFLEELWIDWGSYDDDDDDDNEDWIAEYDIEWR